jgi:hypothetical protein
LTTIASPASSFFKTFLITSPLETLIIRKAFDVVVKDLASALVATTSAKNLKKIILNIQGDGPDARVTLDEMHHLFNEDGNCGMTDMENLVAITNLRKIILEGSTIGNYQVWDMMNGWDEANGRVRRSQRRRGCPGYETLAELTQKLSLC